MAWFSFDAFPNFPYIDPVKKLVQHLTILVVWEVSVVTKVWRILAAVSFNDHTANFTVTLE